MATIRSRSFLVALLAVLTLAAANFASAQSDRSTHVGTTSPNMYIDVHVTLTDTKVTVTPKTAPRGADARFIVVNTGKLPHSFTIGATKHGVGLQTGFSRVVPPGRHLVLLVYLDYRGVMKYYSGTGKKLNHPSYLGNFVVGAQCSLCVQDN